MNTDNAEENKVLEGVRPSKEDLFFMEWGRETLKENISTLNEMFRLFITLDTLLLSAYLGLYESVLGNHYYLSWQAILPALLIIISLIFAIIGIYPFAKSVNLAAPQEIRRYKESRQRFKGRCLAIASGAVVLGFIAFLLARVTLPIPVP
jgi:hypothetical protein